MPASAPTSPKPSSTQDSSQGGLFRKSAVAKSASPDKLDQLVKIVPPLGWVLLWTIVGILIAALAWGIFGQIPDTVEGRGLLLKGGRLETVGATGSGQVTDILVSRNQEIQAGDPVAKVEQTTLRSQIANQEKTVADLRQQYEQIKASAEAQLDSQQTYYTKQRNSVQSSIEDYKQQSQSLEKVVTAQKKLLQEGLIPMTTLLQSQTQLDSTNLNILDAENQLQQISTNLINAKGTAQQSIDSARISLQQAEGSLNNLQSQLQQGETVYARRSGRVVSIDVAVGQTVDPGSQVIVLEKTQEAMAAVLFFPPGLGKKIFPGMEAQISPIMAPVDQYGYLIGKVTEVGDVPATQGSIMALLANTVALDFVTDGGPVIEVTSDVLTDNQSKSGYQWSSSHGPPFEIPSGTTCSARVVVREVRPIELVIPLLKKFFGVDS